MIKVYWKTGITERWFIPRVRPWYNTTQELWVIPKARWFDELSNGYKVPKIYMYNLNEIEHKKEDIEFSACWMWEDYKKAGFYEKMMFINEVTKHFMTCKIGYKYPKDVLYQDYQDMINEKEESYYFKGMYRFSKKHRYAVHKPGQLLFENFLPTLYYGKDNLINLLDWTYKFNATRFYRAIRGIIRHNKKVEKKIKSNNRTTLDFSFRNISKFMCMKMKKRVRPFKWRPVPMYRHIIRKLRYNGLSIYDYEPRYGEKAMAAANEGCEYYYNQTMPFDEYADELADFLGCKFYVDEGYNYDIAIVDFNYFIEEYEEIQYYMDNYREKTDRLLIYVPNKFIDRFRDEHGGQDWEKVRFCKYEPENGRWVKL
jgi:hypothetical protein